MSVVYSVQISGIGLCSSLGGYRDACAAHRAGLNRYTKHDTLAVMNPGDEEAEPLTIAPAANLAGYQSVGRLVKMWLNAYRDLIANTGSPLPVENLLLFMALPDPADREYPVEFDQNISRTERLQSHSELITSPLFARIDPRMNSMPMQMIFGDRVAFARILEKAAQALAQGQAQHCLLLVADSLLNEIVLDRLWGQRQLKTSDNAVGYIPGEGAAMIWLSSPGTNPKALATVNLAIGIDKTTVKTRDLDDESAETPTEERKSWLGRRLMAVVKPLLQSGADARPFPQMVIDINGQENRAMEWGMMQTLLKLDYPNARLLAEQIPALSFGETGVMMGPLALATALASVQRNYARSRDFLITLSENNGKRAAIRIGF